MSERGMQLGLDGSEALPRDPKKRPAVPLSQQANPMVVTLGPGPEGETCGGCRFLYVKHDHGSRRYYGCEFRPRTSGPGSDHLTGWPACAKYEERP